MTFESLPLSDTWLGRPAPIVRIDSHLNISNANKTFLKTFNLVKDDVVLQPASGLLNRLSPETDSKDLFRKLLEASRHFEREHTFQTDSGSEIALPEIKITTPDGKWRWFRLKPIYTYRLGVEMKNQSAKSLRRGLEIEFVDITSEKQKGALIDASKLLNSDLEENKIIEEMQKILHSVLPYDRANLILRVGNNWQLSHKWETDSDGQIKSLSSAKPVDLFKKPLLLKMLVSRNAIYVPDTSKEKDYISTVDTSRPNSWLGTPICVGEEVIGFLNLNHETPNAYTQQEAILLQSFADHIGIAIHNAREHHAKSYTDELTGVWNLRYLREQGQKEVERAKRFKRPLVAAMIDIDHFKKFNDSYGHHVGDQVLCELAQRCSKPTREVGDIFGRYGGEEFSLILPETNLFGGLPLAERLRKNTSEKPFETDKGNLNVNISIGIANINPSSDNSILDILKRADEALYVVKELGGRNAVGVYFEPDIKQGIISNQVAVFIPPTTPTSWEINMYDPTGVLAKDKQMYRIRKRLRIDFSNRYKKGRYDAYRYKIFELFDGSNEQHVGNLDYSEVHYSLTGFGSQLGGEMLLPQDKQAITSLFPSYRDK